MKVNFQKKDILLVVLGLVGGLIISLLVVKSGIQNNHQKNEGNLQNDVSEIMELATQEIRVKKIIIGKDEETWYKVGDRRILISCEAIVKVGVNLKNYLSQPEGNEIEFPKPGILSVNILPSSFEILEEKTGLFRSTFSQNDITKLLKKGEKEIRQKVSKLEIQSVNSEYFFDLPTEFSQINSSN